MKNIKKTIFITGGSTGIGLALAKKYAEANYSVGICARDSKKLPSDLLQTFPNIQFYTADVIDKQQLQQAMDAFILANDSHLDIVIANAGRSSGSKKHLPEYEVIKNILDINIEGVVNTFSLATDIFMRQQHGHLVAIASVAGLLGLPGSAPYSASKAAVLAYCESLAIDFPRYGINVTAIAPEFIDTPLTQQNDHKMPFIMPVEKAAALIKRAIDRRKVRYIFPLRMKLLVLFLAILPRSLYRSLVKLAGYPSS